jgi:hypothetical protein
LRTGNHPGLEHDDIARSDVHLGEDLVRNLGMDVAHPILVLLGLNRDGERLASQPGIKRTATAQPGRTPATREAARSRSVG